MPEQSAANTGPEESQVPVTQEELDGVVSELDELRVKIQQERDDRLRKEAALTDDVQLVALQTERERLLTELANERALTAKVEGSSDVSFTSAEAAMRLAVAQRQGVQDLADAEAKAATEAQSDQAEFVPDAGDVQATTTGGEPSTSAAATAPATTKTTAVSAKAPAGKGK